MGGVVRMACIGYGNNGRMECRDSGGFVSASPLVDFRDEKLVGKTVLVEADRMTVSNGVGIYKLTNPRYVGVAEKGSVPHYALEIKKLL